MPEDYKLCKKCGSNPVIKGKYCEQCTKVGKEKTNKIFAGLGVFLMAGFGIISVISKSKK